MLLSGTELVQIVKAVQGEGTGDGKWDTLCGGDGEGASVQKASLDECLENEGPSQLGPNPLVSDRFLTGAHETWRLVSLGPVY